MISFSTSAFIIGGCLQAVVLERLQMASLCTSIESSFAIVTSFSMIPLSMILATYEALPAHMLERVQTASLLIICSSFIMRLPMTSRIPCCITTSVCSSEPVTKFPQVLSEGITIAEF